MRLRFGLLVSIVLVSILGGLGIAESRMNGSDGPITGNQRLTGKASSPISVTTEVTRPASMDLTRAEPLTNPLTWARENPFLIQEQARRIGWGPDLVDQVPAPARPGAIRLVVIGDSFVWGQGFEDLDERWVSVLQRDLDRRTQPGRFEVVPVGRGGTSSMNQAEWLTPERLARLEPDALVLGFVTNDFWPTFTERHFCQEGACAPTEGGPTVDCGPRCDIASCLLGEGIPTSTFLRKVLFPLFPNVTSWLLYRHCDMDRIAARKGLAKEVSVGRDHSTSPYWPLFIDAVDRFADWGGDIPRFVAHTRVQPFDIDALDASDSAFLRRGFSPVRLDRTHSVLQNFPDTDDLVVNPADPHPNSRLTHAYAADVASAVIERFADQIQSQVPAAPLNLLVSNHLPSSLIVENHTPSLARLTFDPVLADQQGFTTRAELPGRTLPAQYVPCAGMGRPHARVMLRRSLVQGTVVGLTLRSTSWFVVQATGTDRDGETLRGGLLPVAPGVEFRLRLLDGMTGFLLAAPTSGCQGDAELSLPPFTLDIEVLSRTAETS